MTTLVWIIVVLICLAGGIWLGRYTAPGVERARELERERDAAQAETQRYREDVRTHFETTAHLFNQVTGNYRALYEHLADGAERLGTGPASGLLENRPEDRTLVPPDAQEHAPAQAPGSGSDAPEQAAAPHPAEAAGDAPHAGDTTARTAAADEPGAPGEAATDRTGDAAEEPARDQQAPATAPRDHADTDEEAGAADARRT